MTGEEGMPFLRALHRTLNDIDWGFVSCVAQSNVPLGIFVEWLMRPDKP